MSHFEILLIAFGVALDAFAVSLSVSCCKFMQNARARFRLAFHFGLFQFLMPIIGWFSGRMVDPLVERYDHWIAFSLLGWIGLKMIHESFKEEKHEESFDPSRGLNLIVLSIATSIDALAIGISLAVIDINIWYPAVLIGIITATLSLIAILLGNKIGQKFGKKFEIIGGVILIFLGIKILLQHIMA